MERLLKVAMFLFQLLLLLWLFFAINCIFLSDLFVLINQVIHLDVILTLAKFYSTSAMVLRQHGLKDSTYFEQKRHVSSALKYTFLVLVFIKYKFMGLKGFKNHLLFIKLASLYRLNSY